MSDVYGTNKPRAVWFEDFQGHLLNYVVFEGLLLIQRSVDKPHDQEEILPSFGQPAI
jgi:hypothetical protein